MTRTEFSSLAVPGDKSMDTEWAAHAHDPNVTARLIDQTPAQRPRTLINGIWDYDAPGGLMFMDGRDGNRIYMYLNDPGLYLDAQGSPVSEDIARAAGFDVTKYRAERRRSEAMAKARARVAAMTEAELARVEADDDQPPKAAQQQTVVQEHPDLDRRTRQNPNLRGR